jgi:hypothetical protein
MAKMGKSKVLKLKDKLAAAAAAKAAPQAAAAQPAQGEKKVSQKLIETIEKRKKAQAAKSSMFAKPMGRRGRRPKAAVEYTPEHQEEEAYVLESDYEGLEYDTGIRVKENGDDRSFGMDRFEEFDEELNFDW